jgi:hypothetical protein
VPDDRPDARNWRQRRRAIDLIKAAAQRPISMICIGRRLKGCLLERAILTSLSTRGVTRNSTLTSFIVRVWAILR